MLTRICRRIATSWLEFRVTCSSRLLRRGLRQPHPMGTRMRTRIAINNISTERRLSTCQLPQVTSRHHMGRRQVQKHIQHSSLRRWGPHHFPLRRLDLDKGKMGTWTYGTRCRLATSAYSFRFTLAPGAHTCWGLADWWNPIVRSNKCRLEDWDTYISSVSGLAHSHPHPHSTQAHSHPHPHSSARPAHLPASTVAGGSCQGPVH